MEGISMYIFIFILIISTVIQMVRKSKEGPQDQHTIPHPGNQENIPYPYNQESKEPETPRSNTAKRIKSPQTRNFTKEESKETTAPVKAEQEETIDFSINTTEEAKRAIIWSEILQRKY